MLSPINRRRLANFKANRRGYYAFWIFIVIFTISLFAEFIANDKPIVFSMDGRLYFPLWIEYTEKELGGVLETEAEYLDPFVIDLIDKHGWAIWPVVRFSYDTLDWDLDPPYPHSPDSEHWLGTDGGSTDVFAKLLYAFRLSVLFGVTLTLITSSIGVMVGALQGYFGGRVDLIGQRVVEVWAGLPVLFILIILASMVEPNIFWLLGILSLFSWIALVGVVRAEFLRTRNFDYIRAARALGVNNTTIMRRHVLPNAMTAALTFLPFVLIGSVTSLTSLDFLGFGLPPGSPSLGEMLKQGKDNLQAPWLGFTSFFSIAIMLSLMIFIGEAVRDAFDPRKQITGDQG